MEEMARANTEEGISPGMKLRDGKHGVKPTGTREGKAKGRGGRTDRVRDVVPSTIKRDQRDQPKMTPGGDSIRFRLAEDSSGKGIDYRVLDKRSWQALQEYCKVRMHCRTSRS